MINKNLIGISLALVMVLGSVIGTQESDATVCDGMQADISRSMLIFVGTVISLQQIPYDDPLVPFDDGAFMTLSEAKEIFGDNIDDFPAYYQKIKYHYTKYSFSVDEIIKGESLQKEIALVANLKGDNSIGKEYVIMVRENEGGFSLVMSGVCGDSIYDISINDKILTYIKMEDSLPNSDFLELLEINEGQTKYVKDRKIIIGKIDSSLNAENVYLKFENNETDSSFFKLLKIDENGFFTFIKKSRHLPNGDYELTVGISNDKNPIIDKISFPIESKTSYTVNKDGKFCKNNKVPIMKFKDSSINCTSFETRENLIQREWGTWILAQQLRDPSYPESFPEPPPKIKPTALN